MKASRWPIQLALLPIALLVLADFALTQLEVSRSIGSPLLLPILNTIFVTLVSLVGVWLSAQSYAAFGSWPNLILGGGLLSFALANLAGGWLTVTLGTNVAFTTHNAQTLAASMLFFLSGLISLVKVYPSRRQGRLVGIGFVYTGILLCTVLLIYLSWRGMTPVFFNINGSTMVHNLVVGSSALLFSLAAILYIVLYRRSRAAFLYWYMLGLGLIGMAMIALLFSSLMGDAAAWAGRLGQYLGSVYFFIGVLATRREARSAGLSLVETMTSFFQTELAYDLISETARDALVLTDTNGKILLWNATTEKMFHYTSDEAKHLTVFELFAGDAAASFREEFAQIEAVKQRRSVIKKAIVHEDEPLARKRDGTTFPVLFTLSAVKTARGWMTLTAIRDITERKRAETSLRETSNFLDNLFSSANAPIIVWDPEERITRFNHAFERLTGLSAEQVIGKHIGILFPSESREQFLAGIRRTVARELWETQEIQIQRPDETVRTVLWNSATVYAHDGKRALATIGQAQDITEHKKTEEELERYRKELERLVEQRTQMLQEKVLELESAQKELRALSQHLVEAQEAERRNIAYELHDDIGQSITYLSLLMTKMNRLPPEKIPAATEEAKHVLGEVVKEMRKLSFDLQPAILEEFGLTTTLNQYFTDYTSRTGIKVDFTFSEINSKFAKSQLLAIYRICQEALTNIARHAGVNEANVRLWSENDRLFLEILDRGAGFDPQSQQKESFGLISMRERARMLGGKIVIESSPGQGTRIIVDSPLEARSGLQG